MRKSTGFAIFVNAEAVAAPQKLSTMIAQTFSEASPERLERMVILRPSGERFPIESDALVFAAWQDFVNAAAQPLGFYFDGWDAQTVDRSIAQLRQSTWWDRLALCAPGGSGAPALADAVAPYAEAVAMAEHSLAVRRSLNLSFADDMRLDERVLYFLYERDNAELVPQCSLTHRMLYHYPVVEALARRGEEADECLSTLVRRKLLEPSRLIDRTRHCRACASAHIHYVDVCPHCSSLQIRKELALHCFTCGHVAPERDFHVDEGMLVCPQCSTVLRHIGVDYDRPLTQYACGNCHHVFVETTVQARCLECAAVSEPNALDVREIATLRLSSHGRAALRTGQLEESFAALDTANYVEPAYFRRILNWALAVSTRHKEMRFALMLIEFTNALDLIERLGAARLYLLLDEFARRLHEFLRSSDITTRTQEEKLWIFLPFSDPQGLAARLQKALAEMAISNVEESLRIRIYHLQIPENQRENDNAGTLMGRLQGQG